MTIWAREEEEGSKGNERRWREGSRVRHSTSWHSRLARMFRMVSLLDLSSRPWCIPSPRVSSWIRHAVLRAPWGPRETTEREREREREEEPCAVWHGSCSRFSESLISVLLVLFPCRARPLPENPCPRLASPFLPSSCHPCVWRVPLTISSRILEWRCTRLWKWRVCYEVFEDGRNCTVALEYRYKARSSEILMFLFSFFDVDDAADPWTWK